MCLIISSPTGKLAPYNDMYYGFENNPDGWGVAWATGSKVKVKKGFFFEELSDMLHEFEGYPYVLHFRWATHGGNGTDNLHPFKIHKKLYMAHNGVLNVKIENKGMSDTWHLAQQMKPIIYQDRDALQDLGFIEELGNYIGASNKLAFIDAHGRIAVVNREQGEDKDGLWYSNDHSCEPPMGTWKYTNKNFVRGFTKTIDRTVRYAGVPVAEPGEMVGCYMCGSPIDPDDACVVDSDLFVCQQCEHWEAEYTKVGHYRNGDIGYFDDKVNEEEIGRAIAAGLF